MNKILYMYLRKDGSPYYVGIGDPGRQYAPHKHGKNLDLKPKDTTRIKIIEEGLSFEEAKALEKKWIAFYGRKDNGTGILRNRTNGGEGTAGWSPSLESRKKGVETKKQNGTNKRSPESVAKGVETRKNRSGYGLSPESHAKRIATMKARGTNKQTAQTIEKRVESTKASGGYNRSLAAYKKAAATRREKGNHVLSPDAYKRMWETRRSKTYTASQSNNQESNAANFSE